MNNFGSHFFNEAGFQEFAELDFELAIKRLEEGIRSQHIPFIIADTVKGLAGFVGYYTDRDFTVKPIAYMHMFYVVPEWRRSVLARLLVAQAVNLAEGDGASALLVTVAPTGVAGRLLANVFRRCGFMPMGGALMRKL